MKKLLVHDVLGLRSEGKLGLSASPWTPVKSCIQYFGRQIDLNIRALYTLLGCSYSTVVIGSLPRATA